MSLDKTFRALRLDSGAVVTKFDTDGTMAANSDVYVPTQKAVKSYVDAAGRAVQWKNSVKCATTGNGTLSSAYAAGQSVDGYTLVAGDRILLKDQTAGEVNGIYTVNATGAPTRATDMDVASEFPGAVVSVERGTVNADSAWVCTNDSVTVGSTAVVFAIFGGIKAGTGLALTADVIAIDTATTMDLTTAQTATNKRFTSPKINEDVALAATATNIDDAVTKRHTQNTDTGTTGKQFMIDSDSVVGRIRVEATYGASDKELILTNAVLTNNHTATFPDATGTVALTSDLLLEEVRDVPMSFETGEQMTMKVYFPYKVTVNKIRGIVTKAIAGSDNGTITCGNSTGASTSGVITATASAALAVEYAVTPSDNNVVNADSYYYLTSAKSTAGGKVFVSLEVTRTA